MGPRGVRRVGICRSHTSFLKSLPSPLLLCRDVSENKLSVIPREIGALTNLFRLDLHTNYIEELPREVGLLTKLRQL